MTRYGRLGTVLLLVAVAARHATGQTLGTAAAPGGADLPGWLTDWSPLGPVAELGRDFPGATPLASVLTLPGTRIGSFWTAGNPAALRWEVHESYAQFRGGAREHSGDYRRPLDGGSESRRGVSGFGWTNAGAAGAFIGRATVEKVSRPSAAHADVVLPHGSNPFVLLDTIGDAVSGIVARLDGAGGWRIGSLGFGLGLAYDGREVRTVASAVPRQSRTVATGTVAGVTYELAGGLLRLGAFARADRVAQTGLFNAFAAGTRILILRGLSDPNVVDLNDGTSRRYFRRSDRSGSALGLSVGGSAGNVAWTAYAASTRANERQFVEFENDPPTDQWTARGWTGGGAIQALLPGGLLQATVAGAYATLDGEALRMDLPEPHLTRGETDWSVSGELRLLPYRGWSGALIVGTRREHRLTRDSLARVGSDLSAWSPAASVEIARELAAGFALGLGVAAAQYAPWGSVPDPAVMSSAYRDWIAPELALHSTRASAVTWSATIRWSPSARLDLWASGTLGSLAPSSPFARLPLAPQGSREAAAVEIGITMREP